MVSFFRNKCLLQSYKLLAFKLTFCFFYFSLLKKKKIKKQYYLWSGVSEIQEGKFCLRFWLWILCSLRSLLSGACKHKYTESFFSCFVNCLALQTTPTHTNPCYVKVIILGLFSKLKCIRLIFSGGQRLLRLYCFLDLQMKSICFLENVKFLYRSCYG